MANDSPFADALRTYRGGDARGERILTRLGYGQDDSGALRRFREGALTIAARAAAVFRLSRSVDPVDLIGLIVHPADFGIESPADPAISAGGRGVGFRAAFESCVGEAFERLSLQGREPGKGVPDGDALLEAPSRPTGLPDDPETVAGRSMKDGSPVTVPVDKIFRRPAGRRLAPAPPGSAGCAAACTPDEAAVRALLELVERDAVALWWLGGLPGTALLAADVAAVDRVFGGRGDRRRWCLDLTTDLGIPVVAAVSTGLDGTGAIVGAAADFRVSAAAERAVIELFQMEHAAGIAAAKHASGHSLTDGDQLWRRREREVGTDAFPILLPAVDERASADRRHRVTDMAGLLHRIPGDVSCFDVSLPGFGMRASRVLAPCLQPGVLAQITPRLVRVLENTSHDFSLHLHAPAPI